MKKLKLIIPAYLILGLRLALAPVARAVCPVCTVAVAAGLGLSRFLGIDDSISGLWVGGLLLSSSFWFADWLDKSKFKYKSKYWLYVIIVAMYTITFIPLWLGKIIGHPFNTIWGIDKLIFGTTIGSLLFLLALFTDKKVREIKGKQLLPFQKVIFPVSLLAIASLLLYLVIK